jgi:energy-converting hydrogenase A subunit M
MTTKESLKSTLDKLRSQEVALDKKLSFYNISVHEYLDCVDVERLRQELDTLEVMMEDVLSQYQQEWHEYETDESNALIADFMEVCHAPKSNCKFIRSFSGVLPYGHLMDVVDEINNFTATDEDKHLYSVEITESHCIIRQDLSTAVLVQRPRGAKAKEIIYVAVAEFALRFAKYGLSL